MGTLLTTFGVVLLAELAGDKLIYTAGSLTARYRAVVVFAGVAAAAMAKMLVAVLLGTAVSRLPHALVTTVGTLSFLGTAVALWRESSGERDRAPTVVVVTSGWRPVLLSFSTVMLTEWADPGQLAAAAMATRTGALVVVWAGATLAMWTKIILGVALGYAARAWLPRRALRWVGAGTCVVMALLCALGVDW